jgi:hypothetical protein
MTVFNETVEQSLGFQPDTLATTVIKLTQLITIDQQFTESCGLFVLHTLTLQDDYNVQVQYNIVQNDVISLKSDALSISLRSGVLVGADTTDTVETF